MFVNAPSPRPLGARPYPPLFFVSECSLRPFSGLCTGAEASYAPRPVDNWHCGDSALYNLCVTALRLNIMDTVEHQTGLLLGLTLTCTIWVRMRVVIKNPFAKRTTDSQSLFFVHHLFDRHINDIAFIG